MIYGEKDGAATALRAPSESFEAPLRYLKVAWSVEALAEAFEGTLRELRRLRRHLKGPSKPSSTDLQIQFLKLPP